ncbi:MAG TPA: hypothetical protein VLS48_09175 [Anaerolineales bacterium]|nr:hypothetical protein [Anaerolineales bacterium]
MESYFPGLTAELIQAGAVRITDASREVRWFRSGDYHQPGVSNLSGLGVSRPTLESKVRAALLGFQNVQILEGRNVLGLLTTQDNSRVTGVKVENRQADIEEQLEADLVIDAGGRGSRSPAWLAEKGYRQPEVEEVHIGMRYTTCYFQRKPEQIEGIKGITIMPTPPDRHLAVMLAQDGDRWVVTIGGYLGLHTPTELQGFLEAARRLPAPHIYDVIKHAEPRSEPVAYTFPANLRRRYEKLDRFPQGYLVIGDALCSFNPIYGQGMTVAALEAKALDESLSYSQDQLMNKYFMKASNIINDSWNAAVGNDLGYQAVEGPRSPMVRFINWYIGKVHKAAHTDSDVSIAFLKMINMVAPPSSILHPQILWRVLKGNLRSDRILKEGTITLPRQIGNH